MKDSHYDDNDHLCIPPNIYHKPMNHKFFHKLCENKSVRQQIINFLDAIANMERNEFGSLSKKSELRIDITGLSSLLRILLIREITEAVSFYIKQYNYRSIEIPFKIQTIEFNIEIKPTVDQPGNGVIIDIRSYYVILKDLNPKNRESKEKDCAKSLLEYRKVKGNEVMKDGENEEYYKFKILLNVLLDFEVARRLQNWRNSDEKRMNEIKNEMNSLETYISIEEILNLYSELNELYQSYRYFKRSFETRQQDDWCVKPCLRCTTKNRCGNCKNNSGKKQWKIGSAMIKQLEKLGNDKDRLHLLKKVWEYRCQEDFDLDKKKLDLNIFRNWDETDEIKLDDLTTDLEIMCLWGTYDKEYSSYKEKRKKQEDLIELKEILKWSPSIVECEYAEIPIGSAIAVALKLIANGQLKFEELFAVFCNDVNRRTTAAKIIFDLVLRMNEDKLKNLLHEVFGHDENTEERTVNTNNET